MHIDESILYLMKSEKFKKANYLHYLYPEIKQKFKNDALVDKISKEIPNDFEEKRKNGENESYICELIRKDMIEEFIIYINKTFGQLETKIETSIYETNSILITKRPTLIEYAAFFGSIQIFKYLYKNDAKITPSVIVLSIHSQNPEMINFIESITTTREYDKCIKESIKCHHNEITQYFLDNLSQNKMEDNLIKWCLKYNNFCFIESQMITKNLFIEFCKYDYLFFVDFFIKNKDIDITQKVVFIKTFMKLYNSAFL